MPHYLAPGTCPLEIVSEEEWEEDWEEEEGGGVRGGGARSEEVVWHTVFSCPAIPSISSFSLLRLTQVLEGP